MSDFDPGDDQALDAALARSAEAPSTDDTELDDGLLAALRGGRLEPDEAADLEASLAGDPGGRLLLRANADAETDALVTWAESGARAPRRWLRPALAVAAVALVAVGVWRMQPTPAAGWHLDGPHGGVSAKRGDAAPSSVFTAGSRVRLNVVPRSATTEIAWRAYVGSSKGPLARAPTPSRTPGEGGAVRLEWDAATLFGNKDGRWRVVLVPSDAPDLSGRSAQDARRETVHWLETTVEYQTQAR